MRLCSRHRSWQRGRIGRCAPYRAQIRRAGFTEAVETEASVIAALERLRGSGHLP
jgi:hypothetical protein